MVTVQYLQGLNIFVITEFTIATLICLCVSSWGISSRAAELQFLPAGSLLALWKIHRTPQHPTYVASCLTSRVVSVQFHSCNDSVMRVHVVGKLWVPTLKGHSASSQGDHLVQVHRDQMVLETIRRGRLV